MDECMDEYLKTINVWAISNQNIASYVRKNEKFACVIDAMALIMDRESYLLVDSLKYMLGTYPCKHLKVSFPKQDSPYKNMEEIGIGMECDDLIQFLCKIPGRECRYRLYRYAEPLIRYLNGDQFLVNVILQSKENEDNFVLQRSKRKIQFTNYEEKIKKLRDFELFICDNSKFPDDYCASAQFREQIEKIKNEFYIKFDDDRTEDFTEVNDMRKIEVENFMYIQEASKLKKTDEITFSQVICDMGLEDDFFKRMACYRIGGEMKEQKGHRKIAKKGSNSQYIFTKDDLEDMKKIVKRVFLDNCES